MITVFNMFNWWILLLLIDDYAFCFKKNTFLGGFVLMKVWRWWWRWWRELGKKTKKVVFFFCGGSVHLDIVDMHDLIVVFFRKKIKRLKFKKLMKSMVDYS